MRKILVILLFVLVGCAGLIRLPNQAGTKPLNKPIRQVTFTDRNFKPLAQKMSRKFWIRLEKYIQLKKQASLHAWLEAISFPPADLADVIWCIGDHESGNYTESSHPSAGSGWAQFIPSTWRNWYAAWQNSLSPTDLYRSQYYALAYQAPPHVQDMVLVYTLRNGGAHNWDPAFGNDPCTVGM